MTVIATKCFILHCIDDYNTLINLLKEHNCSFSKVETFIDTKQEESVRITATGDRDYLRFVDYLLKKQQKKRQALLDKIKVK